MPPSRTNSIQERLSKLSPDARKRVIRQIQEKRNAAASGIPKVSREQRLPLSFAQQRLWFLDQMREPTVPQESAATSGPDNHDWASPWNEFGAVEIQGQIDPDRLRRALNVIIERHEILRTTFHDDNGRPYQHIHSSKTIDLPRIDLAATCKAESELQKIIRQESHHWFDLEKWPLLRFVLVKTADDRHVLITTIHHIIYDQPSASILTKELMAAYQAFEGESVELPSLSVQYGDFASWERKRVEDGELDHQLDYWREQLHGVPQLIQLSCDYRRPPVPSGRGAIHHFDLPEDLPQQLQKLNHDCGTTEFMTLLAAFSAVLCRYTDQDDLVIGTTLSNRSVSELEGLIGLFVNVMPLRIDLSGQQSKNKRSGELEPRDCQEDPLSFRQLLDRVRTTSLELFKHQELPFEMLIDSLDIERNSSHSPLFQVLFVYHNEVDHFTPTTDIKFTPIPVDPQTAKYDLTLTVGRTQTGYTAAIDYNTDLFRPDTIATFADCFRELVTGAAKAPDTPIRRLPLVSSHETERIDSFSVAASCDDASQICLSSLLESQAQESPDSVALQLDGDELTYQALHARADQLAVLLQDTGVSADQLVALCVERSIEMVVAALAIIKAGGAYVPVAPNDPPLRKAFILQDSNASIVLTQTHLLQDFSNHPAEFVLLDSIEWNQPDQSTATTTLAKQTADGDDLAYVIYTSGSTGQAKGVMITRHSLALHSQSIGEYYSLTKDDVCLQFGSFAFDPSVEEVFSALAAGAKIVLRGLEVWSAKQFVENVAKHKITFCQLPTSYWERLVSDLSGMDIDPSQLSSLRMMTVYGEAMPPRSVKAWRDSALFRNVGLLNSYGPTETTITATSYPISMDLEIGERIPIGRPNGNRRMLILDRHQQPVPGGVPGELYIGGPHVARGYLNRPELTAKKFLQGLAEFQDADLRLYRTGDLVRWRQDGNLEFLGRQDNQLKVRGFRIELGEVEVALRSHPLVEDAAVVATSENTALAAYVVWTPQQAAGNSQLPPEEDLRDHLRSSLPEYMIPATFSSLASMPLTPNGKLDRLSLSSLPSTPLGRRQYEPPNGPIESQLAKVWSDILQTDRIGRHDSFFDLGGHSLLATQLQASIAESLGVSLTLREIFSSPSLLAMSQAVGRHQQERSDKRNTLAARIDQMSPEEVRKLLQEKRSQSKRTNSSSPQ